MFDANAESFVKMDEWCWSKMILYNIHNNISHPHYVYTDVLRLGIYIWGTSILINSKESWNTNIFLACIASIVFSQLMTAWPSVQLFRPWKVYLCFLLIGDSCGFLRQSGPIRTTRFLSPYSVVWRGSQRENKGNKRTCDEMEIKATRKYLPDCTR